MPRPRLAPGVSAIQQCGSYVSLARPPTRHCGQFPPSQGQALGARRGQIIWRMHSALLPPTPCEWNAESAASQLTRERLHAAYSFRESVPSPNQQKAFCNRQASNHSGKHLFPVASPIKH